MTARDSQVFKLPDGRLLGYAEYGSPEGNPVLFFHGFPSSRLEGSGVDAAARKLRLRIIAPDRPGFGLSTPQPNRRITDWPADVRALAGHIGLRSFAVLGGSGGGPYALACAQALPKDMLSAVGIMAGAPPWDAGAHYMPWFARVCSAFAWYFPFGLKLATDLSIGTLKWVVTTGPVTRWLDRYLEQIKKKQDTADPVTDEMEQTSSADERRVRVTRLMFEGFVQGAGPFVQEARLLTENWGFRFEDITYNKIRIWHGVQDTNAPIVMIRSMAERLPYVELKEYEGENHFAVAQHLEEILGELVLSSSSS